MNHGDGDDGYYGALSMIDANVLQIYIGGSKENLN